MSRARRARGAVVRAIVLVLAVPVGILVWLGLVVYEWGAE